MKVCLQRRGLFLVENTLMRISVLDTRLPFSFLLKPEGSFVQALVVEKADLEKHFLGYADHPRYK